MAGLILWKNQEINKLRKDIDRLFDRLWDDFGMPLSTRPSTFRMVDHVVKPWSP